MSHFLLVGFFVVCSTTISLPEAQADNVLVWSTGNTTDHTSSVVTWLQASDQFTSVSGIDQYEALTLDQLLAFDRVLYFSSGGLSQNPTAIGDVLADYSDTGRLLVLATFSWANQGFNTLAGRIISDQLSPFIFQGDSLYSYVTIQSHDDSDFFDGVNEINGYFHDDVLLTTGATEHGIWSDGRPLLASKGNVVAVNLFPDDSRDIHRVTGDHRELFVNALSKGQLIPEPNSMTALVLAAFSLLGYTWRRPTARSRS